MVWLTKSGWEVKGKTAAKLRAKIRDTTKSHNIPLEMSLYLSSYIAALQDRKQADAQTISNLFTSLNQLVNALTGLERILTTPIPFSYSIHLWLVSLIYCFALPFEIWSALKWLTIPATIIVSFAFFGFLVAGEEIENPFGYDRNDLNLDHFTGHVIKNELRAITSAPPPIGGKILSMRLGFPHIRPAFLHHHHHRLKLHRPFSTTSMAATVVNKTAHPFDKARLEALLNHRFFYAPAFEIYGGVAGLYDYGPPGSSLQANIIAEWRKHFIIEEGMLELDTTIMTPAPVFETSGHVARFADWMVKDTKTGDVLRADHLVGGVLEARLAGDKEARGLAAAPPSADKKKKKKNAKAAVVKLDDDVVKEYETILAQVCQPFFP
ncbi:hypothetical protein C0992_008533 [Termitomyces sp. T32_za158]|nr:hypothetical protein C0992_008533 [Termitomyces sp. T32_za158]